MKKRRLPILISLFVSVCSLPAANIAWYTPHPAEDTPSTAAVAAGFTNAPDAGYTKLLTANGHKVTRFLRTADIQNFPDLIAAMDTNDVIVVCRSNPSGDFDTAGETTIWNSVFTKPVLHLGGYAFRGGTGTGSRLGYTTGETMADVTVSQLRLKVNAPGHPVFDGIALDSTNLMVNPYAQRMAFTNATTGVVTNQNGISINNNAIVAGGSIWAVVGTAGSGGLGGMVIGEIPAGTTTSHFNDILAAKRMILLTGSRESGITGEGAGIYDLLPDGQKIFLNTITYLTTPTPTKCTMPLLSTTNVLAGDAWTFDAGPIGPDPLAFQWYKDGAPLTDGTTRQLIFTALDPTNAGSYQLVVTSPSSSATSSVGVVQFTVFPSASITNGLVSYWPLDTVLGTKTVDLVSGYDLGLVNLSAANLVSGRWGQAFQFNGTNSLLERINTAGDLLPIYQHANFSLSFWVNGMPQTDRRVYAEGSTTATAQIFDLGTHNGGANGTVDIFIRPDVGNASPDHAHSTGIAFDGSWHNVVYVQREIAPGIIRAQLWIDGVLDPVVFTPIRPLTMNTTALGGLRRASASAWFAGLIDEAAVWNRALSAEEIGILQVTTITNPPSRLQPLAVNSFKTDLPAVTTGASTTLRWDVSKDANQVTISGLGDVTALTSVGIGSMVITPAQSTNYIITVKRGVDTLSRTTSVAVVQGVAANWTVLDNFDQAQLGNLYASGYWNDTSGNGVQVVAVNGNNAARPTSAGIGFLNLRNLSIGENQARTLFFRIIPGDTSVSGVTNVVGLTDKSQRSYADSYFNIGPVIYPTALTNDAIGATTNGWCIGARNGYQGANVSNPVDFPAPALESGLVYNVWIDVTNQPMSPDSLLDTYSVYIQAEGDSSRTLLFDTYLSDRDLTYVDPVLGGMLPTLDKLILLGNSATANTVFDDFYLSTSGYNSTVPKPYTFAVQPGPLTVKMVGNQVEISWTSGTLQESTTVDGTYTDVPGNPASPYQVTPVGTKFYRARQ